MVSLELGGSFPSFRRKPESRIELNVDTIMDQLVKEWPGILSNVRWNTDTVEQDIVTVLVLEITPHNY